MKNGFKILLASLLIFTAPRLYSGGEVSTTETSYGGSPGFKVWRANGHSQHPGKLNSGDAINSLMGYGYNGSAFTTSPAIGVYLKTNQAWSTTANGTKLTIETTPDDSTTAAEVFSVDDNGNVIAAGAFTAGGGITMGGLPIIGSGTEAVLKASTPTAVGFYYDSTNKAVILSTGTETAASFGMIYDGATAPTGW